MAVGCATAVAHDDRRGTRRLTVESDKFSNGRIILQNDLKNIKKKSYSILACMHMMQKSSGSLIKRRKLM
jgi:phosphotransferase system IIA component